MTFRPLCTIYLPIFAVEVITITTKTINYGQIYQSLFRLRLEKEPDEVVRKRWNYQICKVYVVCILNYIMDPSRPEKYCWDVVRMDPELKLPFSETLNEIYIEMPKFVLPLHECDTLYKKWLYVLNNIEIMERLPQELNNQIFRKLKSIVEVERMTPRSTLGIRIKHIRRTRSFCRPRH